MNARLKLKLMKSPDDIPRHDPQTLSAIQWGKYDKTLGHMVCESIVKATPPIVLHFNPITYHTIRNWLRARHIPF